MEIKVIRKYFTDQSTIGEMSIDGGFECFTLEDVVRADSKVAGATAIPEGKYRVIIDYSNRFRRVMPHILDVPGFEGIRIHSGNTDKDTEGCILLGCSRGDDFIGQSQVAFTDFMKKLKAGLSDGSCFITITHEEQV